MTYRIFRTIFFCQLVLISLVTTTAQTLNSQIVPSDKKQFGFSFEKPFYSNNPGLSTLTGVYQLTINIPVSNRFNLVSSIPYINVNYVLNYYYGIYKYNENGFGNLYIGLQDGPKTADSKKTISFGIFLPTASVKTYPNGLLINYYDIQKYIPNSFGLYFNYGYAKITTEGFFYGFEFGPNFTIPTKKSYLGTDLFIHYGVNAGYQVNKLALNVELLGIGLLTKQANNFIDRFINSINFGAQWKETTITPKIFYKMYLRKEMKDIIDGVLGLGVTVAID